MNQVKIKTTGDEETAKSGSWVLCSHKHWIHWNSGTALNGEKDREPEAYVFNEPEKMYTPITRHSTTGISTGRFYKHCSAK